MIPKTIHYCWFGRNPLPPLAEKCIRSWKKYCPDYEIKEWNEDNFDISACPLYVRQAYDAKKWAFVSDYVRLQLVYTFGGIYLDTDVELLKPLDPLLEYGAFFGFEDGIHVNTGLGFGAEQNSAAVKKMLDDYQNIPFIRDDNSHDTTACPVRNTAALKAFGLIQDNTLQILKGNTAIFPSAYFCPIDYRTGKKRITKNTVAIHWFSMSWKSEAQKELHNAHARAARKADRVHWLRHLPNLILKKILGESNYQLLKQAIKKG